MAAMVVAAAAKMESMEARLVGGVAVAAAEPEKVAMLVAQQRIFLSFIQLTC